MFGCVIHRDKDFATQNLLTPTTLSHLKTITFEMATSGLPTIRACLFDMDGLLIDSEDLYTVCTNEVLREYGRPDLPWNIKAQLQGRPGPEVCNLTFCGRDSSDSYVQVKRNTHNP